MGGDGICPLHHACVVQIHQDRWCQLPSALRLQQELVTGTWGCLVGQLACCLPASAAGHTAARMAGQLLLAGSCRGLVVLGWAVRIGGAVCYAQDANNAAAADALLAQPLALAPWAHPCC